MKNLFLFLILLIGLRSNSQTANDFSSFKAYTDSFSYGVNQGWYSGNWSSQNAAKIAADLGVNSLRVPLYDDFLSNYGINAELWDIQYYLTLGQKNFTAFIGSPNPQNRLDSTFAGTTEQAKVFKGMYLPIWLDSAKTQINPQNTFANYLYNVVKVYGQFIKVYEIINEPDFTYSAGGWMGDQDPNSKESWFSYNPTPSDLVNLRTTFFYYNRLLRISWEVIKRLQPNSYVATGGIGNRSFLDAVYRNTDNPVDGSVTAEYPLKGGAYLDMISFHSYPEYQLKQWDNNLGKQVYFRHSDAAVNVGFLKIKGWMDSISAKYGYDGANYPKKQFICTETGIGRVMDGDSWGSEWGSVNYIIKCLVACQKHDVHELYVYQLGDGATTYQFDQMGMYYWFGDSLPYTGLKETKQGIGFATTSALLKGSVYDSVKTQSLKLSSDIDGGAFRKADGTYTYVLWAKTTLDTNETANGSYQFASAVNRKEWDYSVTGKQTFVSGSASLKGTPSFFQDTIIKTTQVILPVVLKSFTVKEYYNTNILSWETLDETGLGSFELQRSSDGASYSVLYKIMPVGTNYTYQRTDPNPIQAANYYRLKLINKDGSFSYSQILGVENGNHSVNVLVYSISGQLIKVQYTNDIEGLKKTLSTGVYILWIIGEKTTTTQKVIIY